MCLRMRVHVCFGGWRATRRRQAPSSQVDNHSQLDPPCASSVCQNPLQQCSWQSRLCTGWIDTTQTNTAERKHTAPCTLSLFQHTYSCYNTRYSLPLCLSLSFTLPHLHAMITCQSPALARAAAALRPKPLEAPVMITVGFWVAGLLLLEAGVVAFTFSAVAARTTTLRGATC